MLRIAWQTLRARRGTVAGAFLAVALAVVLGGVSGLLMSAALEDPGPGRFAAADAVVVADPTIRLSADESVDAIPAPRLPDGMVARVAAVPGVASATGDLAVPVGVFDTGGRGLRSDGAGVHAHGWDSAALTPFRLDSGRAPAAPDEVVVDSRLGVGVGAVLTIAGPVGSGRHRVSGVATALAATGQGTAVFLPPAVARALSGAPDLVNAVAVVAEPGVAPSDLVARLRDLLGPEVDVVPHASAAEADAGDPQGESRIGLLAIFGTLAGLAAAVALVVVAGTFGLAIAQRRREAASLRALGATPRQVRRLFGAEAAILAVVAGAIGVAASVPLARLVADVLVDRGIAPAGFTIRAHWIPLASAFVLGLLISQAAVVAAARRAGRVRPAEALREVAIEHGRPSPLRVLAGVASIGGGVALALVFSGEHAIGFAVLAGLLLAMGTGLLGRWLLGAVAAALAWPLRALGATGLLASAGLAANRWRSAALATPLLLIAVLVGVQGVVSTSSRAHTDDTSAARVTADHVVAGRDGAPVPAGLAEPIRRLPGVEGVAATLPTDLYGLDPGIDFGAATPAAGLAPGASPDALDLGVEHGSLADLDARSIAVSRAYAGMGRLEVGDPVHVRLADATPVTLRLVAVYERSAGLGDAVIADALARPHTGSPVGGAVFVAGGAEARHSLERFVAHRPELLLMRRAEYLGTLEAAGEDQAWAIWLIIGLAALFATLGLVNTTAMAMSERRDELATIRLLGGTRGQGMRMILMELLPVVAVALAAGGAIVALALRGVPDGVTGFPLEVPVGLLALVAGGLAALTLAAGAVTARIALKAPPASAMRLRE